ncbi:MAG TPA: PilC/PilY family type IV pilus protein [Telluria sp.]
MRWQRILAALVLIVAAGVALAAPQLSVPHGRLGHPGLAGPSAIWQGDADPGGAFLIETTGDLAHAAGTLQRRPLIVGPDGAMTYGAAPVWEAALLLASTANRNVFTNGPAGTTIAFEWASLPVSARASLDQPAPGAMPDGLGPARTAFLRGDRSGEAGQPQGVFRKRIGLLGDIVGSTPLIVGPPSASSAGEGHAAFRERTKGRPLAVYAGANDGMLHAFSAASGAELFAYIPSAPGQRLSALTDPAYTALAYVDGSPGQGDARIGDSWRTVLVSGMGMGARGLFALDITDPAHFTAGLQALWEFGATDDPAMGHVREAPLLARIGTPQRFYALASSGINSLAPNGAGALFLLALDKPPADKWQRASNYHRIDTKGAIAAVANALSAPALVLKEDGSASRAYAGDLQGNLWRFDLGTLKAHCIFTARGADGAVQPIAHAPRVVHAPGGGYLILFATGKLLEASDLLPSSFAQQSVYAIHDGAGAPADVPATRRQLAVRTLTLSAGGYAIKGEIVAWSAPGAKSGWYFDFPNAVKSGERGAGSPVAIAGAVAIASLIPGAAADGAPATRLYLLDAVTGFAYAPIPGDTAGKATGELVALDPTLPLLMLDTGVSKGGRTPTGGVTVTRRVTLVNPHAKAGARQPSVEVRTPSGRLGWREVANWQELHKAASAKHP